MENLTHWKKKLVDVNWIGTYVLPNEQDIIVTLIKVEWKEGVKVMGQAKSCFVATFAPNEYFDKPMILNKTNLKRVTKLTGTPNIEQWTNLNINVTLCQEMDKSVGGGQDWALRIKQTSPDDNMLKELNELYKAKESVLDKDQKAAALRVITNKEARTYAKAIKLLKSIENGSN